jgi:hypothetical protein
MLVVEFQHPLLLTPLHRRNTSTGVGSTGAEDTIAQNLLELLCISLCQLVIASTPTVQRIGLTDAVEIYSLHHHTNFLMQRSVQIQGRGLNRWADFCWHLFKSFQLSFGHSKIFYVWIVSMTWHLDNDLDCIVYELNSIHEN